MSNDLNRKHFSLQDLIIIEVQSAFVTLLGRSTASRPCPKPSISTMRVTPGLTEKERKRAARLFRVDHSGEVCARALYRGQAATARSDSVKTAMAEAAIEEIDHLAWCQDYLRLLHSQPSYLNLFWYTGSWLLGAIVGLIGDEASLGFVAETEHQVMAHLEEHMASLPPNDVKGAAILQAMHADESRHATKALDSGGIKPPAWAKQGMRLMAKVMTLTSYWI